MSSVTTNVVYQSNDIRIHYEHDVYSVLAEKDLPVGTMLLIEHVLSGTLEYLDKKVDKDVKLMTELYPRDYDIAKLKVRMNCFNFDGEFVLGPTFAKFNHSCKPNCHMDIADHVNGGKFYGMWTHKKVKKGDELTIDYVNQSDIDYHDKMKQLHGFKCDCTPEYIMQNSKRSEIHVRLGSTFRTNDAKRIHNLVDMYLDTPRGKRIVKNQAT